MDVLGSLKVSAIPGLHALSGCGTDDSLEDKGKNTCCRVSHHTIDDVPEYLAKY